jgi:Asp-tRNA(Asn)/Glu-tRNA(Gln) amidotransferase A subunit family amidase
VSGGCENLGLRGHGPPQRRAGEQPGRVKRRLATLPPKLGWIDMMMDDVHEYWRRVFHFSPFTVCFNLTGQPAIVLPLAQSDATLERTGTGFPISVQFVARYGDEATLFRLAAQLEKARPWFDRKPPVEM